MRIVVSGTHASGKSTLIGDFAARHPDWRVLPDPFELVDEAPDRPDAGVFFRQVQIAAARLIEPGSGHLIAERGPLDFLAYLDALDALGRPERSRELFRRGIPLTARATAHADLLVLLPLDATDPGGPDDEDPELRAAMDAALLELADDPDLVGDTEIVEITGDRDARLAQLEAAVAQRAR
ncbi:MAG: AAA family ATPase [Microbacterium sp.]|nr:AAA family ATPase [Microbacterium sp.]